MIQGVPINMHGNKVFGTPCKLTFKGTNIAVPVSIVYVDVKIILFLQIYDKSFEIETLTNLKLRLK